MKLKGKFLAAGIVVALVAFPTMAMATTTTEVTKEGSAVTSIQSGDQIQVTSSSPISTTGSIKQSLSSMWSKESLQLTDLDSIVLPEGWVLEVTTDGETWLKRVEFTGDVSTIVGIRAVGDVTTTGKNGFQTTAGSQIVVTQSNFQGASGGDGYDITFGGNKVFNVFHHDNQLRIDCHFKSTGESCFGSVTAYPGYQTGNASMSFWDADKSRLWALAKRAADNGAGFVCVDYSATNPVLCPTAFVSLGSVTNPQALSTATRVGNQAYFVNESDWKLLCLDITAGAACENNGFQLPSSIANPNLAEYGRAASSDDGKVYWSTYNKMGCYDPETNALCGAETTISPIAPQYPLFPVRNAAGDLLGMCLFHSKQCIDGSGQVVDVLPSSLSTWMTNNPLPAWNTYNAGAWAEQDNRIYLNDGPSGTASRDVFCFDYTTGEACAGFAGTNVGVEIYAIIPDPSIPGCLWTNGNAGQITTFNGKTGLSGCSLDYPIVEMPYSAVVPRMSCNETGRVVTWDTIQFNVPEGLNALDLKVTILNASGSPVEGWVDRTPSSTGLLDMASLSVETTGTQPTIQVNAGVVDEALLAQLTATVKFEAEDPELCFTLRAQTTCPEFVPVEGDLSVPDGLIQTASVTYSSTDVALAAGEANTSLTGSGVDTVCAATINKVLLPELETGPTDEGTEEEAGEEVLAETGSNSGLISLALLALMLFVGGAVLVNRAAK